MLFAMLTAVALAGPLPNNADLLRQIARDDTVDAHTRIEAALMALDIVEAQGIDLKTQNLVENLFAEPCDEPATEVEPAGLESVFASALPDGGVQIEAHTSRPVRAMHYLHEKGDERHWVLWLENVSAEAAIVPQGSELADRVRVMPREGVTAIVTELSGDQRVAVEAEQLADGWRLSIRAAGEPTS